MREIENPAEVAEVIEKGVEYMDVHGWHQGHYFPDAHERDGEFTPGKPTCGLGSVAYGVQNRYPVHLRSAAERILNTTLTEEGTVIGFAAFNDHPERTYGDVRDKMLGIAKDLRNDA